MSVVDIANRDAERVMDEILRLLNSGYTIWHWWDESIQPNDSVYTFGFLALVKRE